ncbi:threonine--tRNA ligase [Alicyclobacillus cycloheptanicus]|uniref:Threonine--tRNA ligase n=1 Tax=Alicyclobacillus cycloheptanicus TaxID=1457 RepID=A0ABT9XES1_9BACL|nr:threonine--tRNA ligase [Alicyclobacillus cycloheptanicus]MDQ0188800.1 threonyl-tRNA synthetase [Alicyclobacillus cycloheptanicus]WDM00547.1 threonine--tRNA ligase [Alicyclobacillus cycloheptanicus]
MQEVKQQVKARLKDGSERIYDAGTTFADIAASISAGLAREAVAAKVNGKVLDLSRTLDEDADVELLTLRDPEGVDVMRHTCAHVMAQAVARVFPGTKFAIGPVIENGFYYDFADHDFTPDDLPRIEAEMQKIIKEDFPVIREVISRDEALAMFRAREDRFKVEIIQDLPAAETITIYKQGEFVDLCRGPHLPSTGRIKAFKLMSIAGAYWRGDASREMLTRLYAVAFAKKSELEEYLKRLEEAKQRDHRRLGKELELFMFSEEAPGMPFYLPNGLIIRNQLEAYERSLQVAAGYQEVRTPIIMNQRLWEQSGHWGHYQENMYVTRVDEELFAMKPMNCPGHMLIFKHKQRSYRDLPLRIAEYGQVHRHELSGTLGGMMRVRTFTQDDAHIFCRPDQIESEIQGVLKLVETIYGVFGFSYHMELSTRPEDSMGSDELWEQAESALKRALEGAGVAYRINPGDGAFYGPKIDFHVRDAIGRTWQCATVQLDFQMPERFDLSYVGADNERYRPVVIHRAIFGSVDRFIGILTEHFGGAFPAWLAPVQVRVLPVGADYVDYADKVAGTLRDAGFRVEVDARSEKIGYKIREAQVLKTPYTLVVGEREQSEGSVSVRRYGTGDQGQIPLGDFEARLRDEVDRKALLVGSQMQ